MSNDTEDRVFPWNDGLPTKPDVDSLLKAFPPENIKPGAWKATDDEIRKHIGRCDGVRYRTVYMAWRKRLERDHRVIVFRQESIGFFCPTPDEVFAVTHPTYEHVGRSINKQMKHVSIVQPENDTQRMTQEHHGRLLYATKRSLKKDRMNVLPSTDVQDVPKIQPPVKA